MPPVRASPDYNLAKNHPEVLKSWDYLKNTKSPEEYTPKSPQKVWWICHICGHEHEEKIQNKTREGQEKCANCLGRAVHSSGRNSLAAERPELVKDWFDSRSPIEFRTGSKYMAKWKCHKCDHIWETRIYKRAELGRGCLPCFGTGVHSSGSNSIEKLHPDLMSEWDDQRNPSDIHPGSVKKIQWKCRDCNHTYLMPPKSRTGPRKSGCTFCRGPGGVKAAIVHSDGRNSMRKTHPSLASEFHPTMNGKHTPDNLVAGTNKKLWWQCTLPCEFTEGEICANVWKASGAKRATRKQKCPVHEAGGLHSDRKNSLQNLFPELMEEWDFNRNQGVNPNDITMGMHKNVNWICRQCNFEYKARVNHRTSSGSGCPSCKKKTQTILFNFIKEIYTEHEVEFDYKHPDLRFSPSGKAKLKGRKGSRMELDIWIEKLSIAIEYQGEQHFKPIKHWGGKQALVKQKIRDDEKLSACRNAGISLIYINYDWDLTKESLIEIISRHGVIVP